MLRSSQSRFEKRRCSCHKRIYCYCNPESCPSSKEDSGWLEFRTYGGRHSRPLGDGKNHCAHHKPAQVHVTICQITLASGLVSAPAHADASPPQTAPGSNWQEPKSHFATGRTILHFLSRKYVCRRDYRANEEEEAGRDGFQIESH